MNETRTTKRLVPNTDEGNRSLARSCPGREDHAPSCPEDDCVEIPLLLANELVLAHRHRTPHVPAWSPSQKRLRGHDESLLKVMLFMHL